MPNLLWFEWERDVDGYRIEELKPGEAPEYEIERNRGCLVPIGRAALRYRPLDECPGMFMEFARCKQTPESAKTFADKYGLLVSPNKPMPLVEFNSWILMMVTALEFWEHGLKIQDLSPLIEGFNARADMKAHVRFGTSWDDSHPALYIVPNNLLSARWLQFAQAVSSNTEFRKCLHCPAWFTYGPGTGRRKTAFYCSARCRRAAHRSKEKRK